MDRDTRISLEKKFDLEFDKVPSRRQVYAFMDCLVSSMFPVLEEGWVKKEERGIDSSIDCLRDLLDSFDNGLEDTVKLTEEFRQSLTGIHELVITDAKAICEGDPAARSIEEVIITYPGFYAILVYRLANKLDRLGVPVIPRMMTEYAHRQTGIDIHPGATIGASFCIDHGTGIVIGETTDIGEHVKIYQGVTLGATSVEKEKAGTKRHPTIEDNVVVYSGTTILGGETRIGHHSIVGGNCWLTKSVQPHSLVINRSEVHLIDKHPNRGEIIDFVI